MSDETMDHMASGLLAHIATMCVNDSKAYYPEVAKSITHHSLGLCGEAGEVANLVKKIDRGDVGIGDSNALDYEIVDAFIYLMCLVGLRKMDLWALYNSKRQINNERFIHITPMFDREGKALASEEEGE